ncbi:MAG: hypothetical protein LBT56_09000 [Prevotellaceae bacterium]|jgi:hypothetical protein|nr:hypothetical protein [Prevotellaceae bacterium]
MIKKSRRDYRYVEKLTAICRFVETDNYPSLRPQISFLRRDGTSKKVLAEIINHFP